MQLDVKRGDDRESLSRASSEHDPNDLNPSTPSSGRTWMKIQEGQIKTTMMDATGACHSTAGPAVSGIARRCGIQSA